MTFWVRSNLARFVALLLLAPAATAQQSPPAQSPDAALAAKPPAGEKAPPGPPPLDLGLKLELEPKAIEILKAMSQTLANARTLSFTSVATYESPSRTGQPLVYLTQSAVTMQRPNKLRVLTPADGPPQEFYYDGKTMTAFEPESDLVAIAEAPPTIDAMLKAAYDKAAIYFPFTDLLVADPFKDIAEGLKLAFVVGQSKVVGGVTTDVIALANDEVQGQLWVGVEDKLPRLFRATYFNEPGNFRHAVVLSDWRLDPPVPANSFVSPRAAAAKRIPFAAPEPQPDAPAADSKGATKP